MGDDVLKKVSNVFSSSTKRADDYCFRIGGEEFCIIFNAIDKAKALDFIEQIKEKVENLKIPHAKNRSEEHTSELQSPLYLVCRLLLEKKKV